MTPKIPPPLSLALDFLRTRQGWTQKGLAEASGIPANLISDYERGRKVLSRERLESMAAVMGLKAKAVDSALDFLQKTHSGTQEGEMPSAQSSIEAVASRSGRMMAGFTRSLLKMLTSEASALEARQEALALWARLKRLSVAQQRAEVEKKGEFRRWALCELLCEESIRAAGDSADRALELANLALHLAGLTPGEEAWRQRLQGYAWAHVGNARRVKGDLPAANEAFERSQTLWTVGIPGDSGPLNEARVLGLRSSLLREQRKFVEALELLNQALALSKESETQYLLLNKAKLLEEADDSRGAIAALQMAAPIIELEGQTRFLLLLKHNLALSLCSLGRYREVEKQLPGLEELAITVGNDLDKLRLHWLKGRFFAGLGWKEKAISAFSLVREGLVFREIAFDAALVSLEMAVLYLEGRQLEEVKNLARQMASMFQMQGIHREALAALMLFRDAAERKTLTLDLARELIDYFRRARNNPTLKFEVR
jgi:transcriptional regulator with XRE-family HTH domain